MAKRDFYVDGMTVDEILSLGTNELNSLSERDMSRALRTVSLAANKRIDRLMDNAIKRHNQYILKKSAKHNISLDALNKLYDEAGQDSKAIRFSVGKKSRNEMYAELSRARDFMSLKTSTIKGATEVRKVRESRLFGKTSEAVRKNAEKQFIKDFKEATGKKPTKKMIKQYTKEALEEYSRLNSEAWSNVRKFMEMENLHGKFKGSDSIIELIGLRTYAEDSEEDILTQAKIAFDAKYKERQEMLYREEKAFFAEENAFTSYDDYSEDW